MRVFPKKHRSFSYFGNQYGRVQFYYSYHIKIRENGTSKMDEEDDAMDKLVCIRVPEMHDLNFILDLFIMNRTLLLAGDEGLPIQCENKETKANV